MEENKKSCETCAHRDEPARSRVCIDCWSYQRWRNWSPDGREEEKP